MAVVAAVALVSCNDKKATENADANNVDSALIVTEEEEIIAIDTTGAANSNAIADTTAAKTAQTADSTKTAK